MYETFADLDEALADLDEDALAGRGAATIRTPEPPVIDQPRTDPNGHDPDGYDPADFETPRLTTEAPDPAPAATGGPGFETITLSDFDPADVDIRDFMDEPPAVTTMPPDDEPSFARPASAGGPEAPQSAPTGRPIPQPRDPGPKANPGAGGSLTRPVADLSRALRFYRDVLGFTVVFTSAKSAVVEHQGSRVLLDEHGIQPTPGEVHLDVTDIEEVCAAVRASVGEVVEPPAPVHGGSGLQLWRARLRDPDGHAVEVIEWRNGGAN
ncbi:MAG: VOC family protein [Dactylosporangium sp.]|nr:VOC family protein [Dactylosporangium sp.]